MAIADDFYIDYYNKLIAHSPSSVAYTGLTGTFIAGELVTWSAGAQSARLVTDNGTTTMNIAYATNTPTGTITGATSGATATFSTITSKTTTYTTRALYSFLQDTFDELGQLDDTVPMSAQTPTEFTLINDWFIDDESVKFLTGGALTLSAASDANQAVRLISFGGTYTNAEPDDVGLPVTGTGGSSGTLLHYNNTSKKWWIRVDDSGDTFAPAETTAVTGGTGTGTSLGTSTTGEALYANIYTLGTIAIDPNPETYVFQNSEAINPWWGRGDSESHIDVLIKVKESGTEIDGAQITVFVRHYGDLYDHFPIDLTSGGRQAVPLASAADLNNNVTGEGYLLYDAQSGNFTVNLIITGATSGATAEILADTDWGTTGVLTLGHVKGVFQDGEIITDTSTGSAAVNGQNASNAIGYSYLLYDGETGGGFTVGDTITGVTSGATGVLRGIQDDGTDGKLVIEPTNYLDYIDNENLQVSATTRGVANGNTTRSVVAYDDINLWFVNESISHGAITNGPFVAGEPITGSIAGAGTFLDTTAGVMHIGNVTSSFATGEIITGGTSGATTTTSSGPTADFQLDKAFTQGSLNPYSVIINCAGRTMAEVYEWLKYVTRESANSTDQVNYITMYPLNNGLVVPHDGEEYIAARYSPDTVFTPVKASPFGTFAGGKFFGARGVWVYNMDNADIQAFQLIDSNGTTQTPPNFQSLTITNLLSGDRVLVARTSSGTTINKAVFTLSNTAGDNELGDGTVVVTGGSNAIPSDTPDSGFIRLVKVSDTSINREERYAYTSWSGDTFTLSGTLTRAYDSGSDTAYVPYIDATASGTSESVTVIYSADRTVVARIRRYNGAGDSILPFETSGTFSSTGYSTVTIRTDDTIVT